MTARPNLNNRVERLALKNKNSDVKGSDKNEDVIDKNKELCEDKCPLIIPRGVLILMATLAFLVAAAAWALANKELINEHIPGQGHKRTNDLSQPLAVEKAGFFDDSTARQLRECAGNNPMVGRNTLSDAFAATRGVVAYFDEKGVQDLAAHPDLGCLLPYFERVRDLTANAWVINVVVVDAGTEAAPVRWHLDQSANLHLRAFFPRFMPASVSVW